MKDVDLEKEIDEVIHNYKVDNHRHTSICSADIEWIAKHFFELGLKIKENEVMTQEEKVDLEIEIILWTNAIPEIRYDDVKRIAEYFYELGLKTKKGE